MSNEASEVENKETKNLCKRGCGFYGSVQFKDMCSKCYQEHLKCETDIARSSSLDLSGTRVSSCLDCTESVPIIPQRVKVRPESCPSLSQPPLALKRKASVSIDDVRTESTTSSSCVNRCVWCRKRVGLTGFLCRCEGLFCSLHRYSDQHECTYDYQGNGRIELARANPEVRCPKIRKL